jgi:hypothetical protein
MRAVFGGLHSPNDGGKEKKQQVNPALRLPAERQVPLKI